MFVTRGGRHDRADLQEFIEAQRGGEVDISEGTAMIAREGSIVGCIRLIEVESGTLVYDDVLVAEGHDETVAKQLIQAAMNNKGGTIFAAVPAAETEFFSTFGFAPIDRSDAPQPVAEYWSSHPGPGGGLVHLKAR
jgi:N-acetylglutamate synthase-like GNAT family acetyltransferase